VVPNIASASVTNPRVHGKGVLIRVGSYVLCISEIYTGSFKKNCGFEQRTQNSRNTKFSDLHR